MEDFQTARAVRALIDAAGGQSELAKRLGFTRQRVDNWRAKGFIPLMVVRAYRDVFKRIMARAAKETA